MYPPDVMCGSGMGPGVDSPAVKDIEGTIEKTQIWKEDYMILRVIINFLGCDNVTLAT